jgi:hypothetical protein
VNNPVTQTHLEAPEASQLLKKRDSGEGSERTEQVTIQEIAFLKIV